MDNTDPGFDDFRPRGWLDGAGYIVLGLASLGIAGVLIRVFFLDGPTGLFPDIYILFPILVLLIVVWMIGWGLRKAGRRRHPKET
jgi:hypothetical protein